MCSAHDELVWIDCEMTGLDLSHDRLIEIAVIVTDGQLNLLDDGIDLVIHASDEDLDSMSPFVTEMHTRSGLIEQVRQSSLELAQAQQQVLDYIRRYIPQPGSVPLAGNSIATDRGFLARDMPEVDHYLHYRMVDVSSIKELCRRWFPRIYFGQPSKGLAHRALADIYESIQELRFYRATAFVDQPGPSTAQIAEIAQQFSTEPFPLRHTDSPSDQPNS